MSKTDFYEEQVVLHSCGYENAYAWPTITPWLGLFLSTPTDQGTGTEVAAAGYERFDLTGYFLETAIIPGERTNITPVVMSEPQEDYGLVIGYGIFDDDTGGNCIRATPLLTPFTVLNGVPPSFAAGKLLIREG